MEKKGRNGEKKDILGENKVLVIFIHLNCFTLTKIAPKNQPHPLFWISLLPYLSRIVRGGRNSWPLTFLFIFTSQKSHFPSSLHFFLIYHFTMCFQISFHPFFLIYPFHFVCLLSVCCFKIIIISSHEFYFSNSLFIPPFWFFLCHF